MPFFNTPHLLFAADIIHLILPLLAVIFAVVKHLMSAGKPVAKQPGGPLIAGAPKPKPIENPAKPVPVGGQQADQLRSQVEEFLRRSGRPQQGTPAPAAQQRPTSEIELLVPPSRSTAPKSPLPSEKRSQRRMKRRQSVEEHVKEQVAASAQSLAEKASQLGQRIVTEDQQFDIQLKSKFDHALGSLGGTDSSTPPTAEVRPSNTPAAQIAAMLANPDGVRQAVLVNEILRRPTDHW